MDDVIPTTYEAWRRCITVHCSIPLTAEYIGKRIAILRNENDTETRRFTALYGEDHRRRVLDWFVRSSKEV